VSSKISIAQVKNKEFNFPEKDKVLSRQKNPNGWILNEPKIIWAAG